MIHKSLQNFDRIIDVSMSSFAPEFKENSYRDGKREFNEPTSNTERELHGAIALLLGCDQYQISLIDERTKTKADLSVDIQSSSYAIWEENE